MRRFCVRSLLIAGIATSASLGGCGLAHRARTAAGGPAEYREPIPLQVRNENYLDMNISVVSHGVARRVGTVSGNSNGAFSIDPSTVVGTDITILATPIGGSGRASSGSLSVAEGQHIEFRIGSVLRQSAAVVR